MKGITYINTTDNLSINIGGVMPLFRLRNMVKVFVKVCNISKTIKAIHFKLSTLIYFQRDNLYQHDR